MENLDFHNLLRCMMIILPILTTSLIRFSLKGSFWILGSERVKNGDSCYVAFQANGLVEVETYNRQEGTLMRFWYPISAVESPSRSLVRAASHGLRADATRHGDLHRELLHTEAAVTHMCCRAALTQLGSTEELAGIPGESPSIKSFIFM